MLIHRLATGVLLNINHQKKTEYRPNIDHTALYRPNIDRYLKSGQINFFKWIFYLIVMSLTYTWKIIFIVYYRSTIIVPNYEMYWQITTGWLPGGQSTPIWTTPNWTTLNWTNPIWSRWSGLTPFGLTPIRLNTIWTTPKLTPFGLPPFGLRGHLDYTHLD